MDDVTRPALKDLYAFLGAIIFVIAAARSFRLWSRFTSKNAHLALGIRLGAGFFPLACLITAWVLLYWLLTDA